LSCIESLLEFFCCAGAPDRPDVGGSRYFGLLEFFCCAGAPDRPDVGGSRYFG
jgi:hypothetical protein